MRRLRRVAATVTTVAVLGLSAACGGDNPTPSTAPSASPSPTESAPTDSAPVVPDAARSTADAGVGRFAEHYVDLINFATRTGEINELKEASATSCKSCNALQERIAKVYRDGGTIRSQGWKVTGTEVVPDQPLNRKYVDIAILQSPQLVTPSSGADVQKFPGGKQALSMTLARQGQTWSVTSLSLAEQS